MKCPLCNVETAIASSRYVIKSENDEQKLFIEQDMKCRSHNCSNYNKIVETVRNELPVSKDSVETQ